MNLRIPFRKKGILKALLHYLRVCDQMVMFIVSSVSLAAPTEMKMRFRFILLLCDMWWMPGG